MVTKMGKVIAVFKNRHRIALKRAFDRWQAETVIKSQIVDLKTKIEKVSLAVADQQEEVQKLTQQSNAVKT